MVMEYMRELCFSVKEGEGIEEPPRMLVNLPSMGFRVCEFACCHLHSMCGPRDYNSRPVRG